LTWRFRLRDDAYYQDSPCFAGGKGRKVTAQDFVWCWKRLMTVPTSQGAWIFEGKIKGLDAWAARMKPELSKFQDKKNEYFRIELVMLENAQPRWLQFDGGDLDRIEADKDIWEEAMDDQGRLRADLAGRGIWLQKKAEMDLAFTAFNMDDAVLGAPNGDRGRK